MRCLATAFLFGLFCSALCEDPVVVDGPPELNISTQYALSWNAYDKKAIYCVEKNMNEPMKWYSPSGAIINPLSPNNRRIYVEKKKGQKENERLLILLIQSLRLSDSGTWTCKAGNFTVQYKVNVIIKASINVSEEYKEADEDSSVTLTCKVYGEPKPLVQWYLDSDLITGDDKKKYEIKEEINDNEYSLTIHNLNYNDTQEYYCKATQKTSTDFASKAIKLQVRYAPLLVESEYCLSPTYDEQPRLMDTPRDTSGSQKSKKSKTYSTVLEFYAVMNATKEIVVCVIAYPEPTHTWVRRKDKYDSNIPDDWVVTNKTEKKLHTGYYSILSLRINSEDDLGMYLDKVHNSVGRLNVNCDVSLGETPPQPDKATLKNANHTHLVFDVECSACIWPNESLPEDPKNLSVIGFDFSLTPFVEGYPPDWDNAKEFELPVQEEYFVGPLDNSTTFHARLRSRNDAGVSEWVPIEPDPATKHAVNITFSTISIVISLICIFWISD